MYLLTIITIMKKQKISDRENEFVITSNNYEDDSCPICVFLKKAEIEKVDPTYEEINEVFRLVEDI